MEPGTGVCPRSSLLRRFTERGGLWVALQGILMLSVLIAAPLDRATEPRRWGWIAGGACLATAAGVGLAGALALGRSLTPFPRPQPNAPLVQRGIYAWVRHPLYTSVLLASAGWALIWQSPIAGAVVTTMAAFFDAKARREELWLRQSFPAYPAYARRTKRFIPRVY